MRPRKTKSPSLSIVLPTYNEAGNILPLIHELTRVLKKSHIIAEILVVDDDSPDKTAQLVMKEARKNPQLRVFVRKSNRGLAVSILDGIHHASGEMILVMDTDFNHAPEVIPHMVKMLANCDLVVGSRFIKGGGMENKIRNTLSRLFNFYLRAILNSPVHDHLSGFFLMQRSKLRTYANPTVFYGFGDYFIRLIYCTQKANLKIREVPIYYKNRTWGQSKSKFVSMFVQYTKTAISLRFNNA